MYVIPFFIKRKKNKTKQLLKSHIDVLIVLKLKLKKDKLDLTLPNNPPILSYRQNHRTVAS